jgi:hypothetical protein
MLAKQCKLSSAKSIREYQVLKKYQEYWTSRTSTIRSTRSSRKESLAVPVKLAGLA